MARSFNGTSDVIHADAAHLTNGGAAFSIAAWIKASPKKFGMVYAEGKAGSAGPFFLFMLAGSSPGTGAQLEINMRSLTSGGVDAFQGTGIAADGTWHHVCVTQNTSNNLTVYIDAAVDSTFTRTFLSNGGLQPISNATIGADQRVSTGDWFNGLIAQGATWSRQLSAQEVKSLAAGLLPSHLGPAHYWPLWGGDSPEPDIGTGTHVAGTLTGTTQGAGGPRVGLSMLRLAS